MKGVCSRQGCTYQVLEKVSRNGETRCVDTLNSAQYSDDGGEWKGCGWAPVKPPLPPSFQHTECYFHRKETLGLFDARPEHFNPDRPCPTTSPTIYRVKDKDNLAQMANLLTKGVDDADMF